MAQIYLKYLCEFILMKENMHLTHCIENQTEILKHR